MESSFTKGYERTVAEDGTITLKYRTSRFGGPSAALGLLIGMGLLPATMIGSAMISMILGNSLSGVPFVVGIGVWIWMLFILYKGTFEIKIKPLVGITFEGKKLPFKDITHIGTSNFGNSAFVLANSHGTEIAIGKYVTIALAGAVAQEIRDASGMTWS
ncbi:hypothetical protein [Xylophilus ampelinus]|uniref:hypothetical protein n=1 Tax=Xylophilus ampelinus TaxID=54067 RepID=UPI0011B36614|nr:hypothetical protein [Xylophilus ampelinus]MCS4510382.1 hypothetical protein [Xylophilus ampelinus]